MATEVARTTDAAKPPQLGAVERVLIGGDISRLSEQDRLVYYKATCESLGLNPLTKPFNYIELNGELQLYAKRDCTDQLRKIHAISVKIVNREIVDGVYVVTARAVTPDSREDESIGAVPLVKEGGQWKTSSGGKKYFEANGEVSQLSPTARADAMMKAETKSKRRVTLSICGLGLLDESEVDAMAELRTQVERIDTGGHPIGTQDAADHVRDQKLRAIASAPELQEILDGIESNPQKAGTAFSKLRDDLEARGTAGVEEYRRIEAAFAEKYPKGTIDRGALKDFAALLFGAILKLDSQAKDPEPVTEEPPSAEPQTPRSKFDLGRKR